jgi:hypothetical protein
MNPAIIATLSVVGVLLVGGMVAAALVFAHYSKALRAHPASFSKDAGGLKEGGGNAAIGSSSGTNTASSSASDPSPLPLRAIDVPPGVSVSPFMLLDEQAVAAMMAAAPFAVTVEGGEGEGGSGGNTSAEDSWSRQGPMGRMHGGPHDGSSKLDRIGGSASWSGHDNSESGVSKSGELMPLEPQGWRSQSGLGMPPSLTTRSSTARELLEAFARLYSKREQPDFGVLAELLDQDVDRGGDGGAAVRRRQQQQQQPELVLRSQGSTPALLAHGQLSPADLVRQQLQVREGAEGEDASALLLQRMASQLPSDTPPLAALPTTPIASAGALGASAIASAAALAAATASGNRGETALEQQVQQQQAQQQQAQQDEFPEWSIEPEDIEICRREDGTYWQLGSGAFGTVYKGQYNGMQTVAVKVLHPVEDERRSADSIREILLLKKLRDRNIVQVWGGWVWVAGGGGGGYVGEGEGRGGGWERGGGGLGQRVGGGVLFWGVFAAATRVSPFLLRRMPVRAAVHACEGAAQHQGAAAC